MSDLPAPGAPLQLNDGSLIDPVTRSTVSVEVPRHSAVRDHMMRVERKLQDLPDVPRRMNVLSIIVTYSLFGLSDTEIATALELPEPRIAALKALKPYQDMLSEVTKAAVRRDGDEVRQLVRDNSERAALAMVELLGSERETTKLAAAKDILDRSGNRPDDVKTENRRMSATLRIEHVVRSEDDSVPHHAQVIDAEFVDG